MPLYPAIKLTDAVITDTFHFQPQLTSEPTAAALGDFDNNGDVDGRDFLIWRRGDAAPAMSDALSQKAEQAWAADSFEWKTSDGHDSASHTLGAQWVLCDGSVRPIYDSGGQQTDSGYGNPSSFQIISQGGEPMAIDWFPTETIRPTESFFVA